MLHTFVAIVQDKPGTLTRVASLFRRLNINIVSLTVGESERPDTSRMTIVCEAPDHAAHRIRASLYKLETTVEVDEVNRAEAVVRELCLIKVAAGPNSAARRPLALADLRARQRLPRPRRRPRARVHHARDDRLRLQDRRPPPGPPRIRLRGPRGLTHRPHGHAPRPPHRPRSQSPRHQTRRATGHPRSRRPCPTTKSFPPSSTRPEPHMNRREFLKSSASLSAATLSPRALRALAPDSIAPLHQLDYSQVQLLDSLLLQQFDHNHALFLALDDDRLLKPFRQLTGMPAPGEDMGGWYSPSPKFDPAQEFHRLRPRPHLRPVGLRALRAPTPSPATRPHSKRFISSSPATPRPSHRSFTLITVSLAIPSTRSSAGSSTLTSSLRIPSLSRF